MSCSNSSTLLPWVSSYSFCRAFSNCPSRLSRSCRSSEFCNAKFRHHPEKDFCIKWDDWQQKELFWMLME
ncbi:hypothetical protein Y032_0068g272 [Ancylostoma ceylanicum]|uniref:Uncharacterized protein n=1 Tax=Ancylostoma ceylanicum TaxID=53326 RepID=A0A016TZS6_9BILA|nr:hypothetical protein Y032_0068g272 [Ancylostoma ceylanicum]